MSFDASRLRRGEWIVGAGGILLLASMLLLPWSGYPGGHTLDGWNALTHFRWLAVVTLVLVGALVLFQATRRAPALPVTLSLFAAALGAATSVWLIYRVGISPTGGRKAGGWVGLAGALAITYGGYASLRKEGIAAGDQPAEIPTVSPRAHGGS
jgi:hypothetical protein